MRRAVLAMCLVPAGCSWAQERLQPAVVETGANLPPRPIAVGDLLAISVYGAPELSHTARVNREGGIRLPLLNRQVAAQGLSPAELEQRVGAAIEEAKILVEPMVAITIAQYGTRPIRVAGAVRRPLTFDISAPVSLLEALTRAEGLSGDAGADILVTQAAPAADLVTKRIAVKDLFEKADPAANVLLQGDEEVRVPQAGRVFVVGNVKKPGAFPVGDAAGVSVLKAVALAEGLAPFSTRLAYIYRGSGQKQEIEVSLRDIMNRKKPDVELEAGDIFYIPDNRGGRITANALEKAVSFAAGTASGALILGVTR